MNSVNPYKQVLLNPGSSMRYQLTPLHIAVMTGEISAVERALESDCNPNAKDIRGWTPLHHAALKSSQMMTLLMQKGADASLRNKDNGTALDLYRMANAPKVPLKSPIYALKEDGSHEEISRDEFNARTGATFIEYPYIPAADQVRIWMRPPRQEGDDFTTEFETYLENPPRLALTSEAPLDENGTPLPVGRSVVTLDEIPKGAVVTHFCGKYTNASSFGCGDHKLDSMDGARFRNWGPQLADGFPNTMTLPSKPLHGASRVVVIALEAIPKGSPITIDYSTHQCKWGGRRDGLTDAEILKLSHLELRPSALQAAVKSHNISAPIPHLDYRIIATVSYVLDTPSAFFKLVLSGVIKLEDVKKAMQKTNFTRNNISQFSFLFGPLQKLLRPEYAEAKACVLEAAQRGRIQFVTRLLSTFCDNPQKYRNGSYQPLFKKLIDQGKDIAALELFAGIGS